MITVNVLGAGRWGPNMIRAFSNLPHARVGMVADLDEKRLAMVSSRLADVETTTDPIAALEDPRAEAIAIATPVCTHFDLARRALEAGKHVLVEKPLCPTTEECEELMQLAEQRGLLLAVGHVFLFNAGIRKVKEYIDSGHLGRLQYIHAVRTNLGPVRDDVNALWDLAAHDLSIFQYWLDQRATHVNAAGQRSLGQGTEDVVIAHYTYPGNILATAYVSWLNPRKVREITVVGDRRMVVWNDMDMIEPVRVYDKQIEVSPASQYADSFVAFQAQIRDGDVHIPRIQATEPLAAECRHFIDCIEEQTELVNDAGLARDVVAALQASDSSIAQQGQSVAISQPSPTATATAPEPVSVS